MKNFRLLVSLFLGFWSMLLGAQNCPPTQCNGVPNAMFSSLSQPLSTNLTDPFDNQNGVVNDWTQSHGSPLLSDTTFFSAPYSAHMDSEDGTSGTGDGVVTNISISQGRQYALSFYIRANSNSDIVDHFYVQLTSGLVPSGTATRPIPTASQEVHHELGFKEVTFQRKVICFTADANYSQLYFFPENNTGANPSEIFLDEIELIDLDCIEAGTDQLSCSGQSVTLSTANCEILNATTYNWVDVANLGSSLGSGPNLTIVPTDTTTYRLTRTVAGCSTSDEVTVNMISEDVEVTVSSDQNFACAGQAVTYTVNIRNTNANVATPLLDINQFFSPGIVSSCPNGVFEVISSNLPSTITLAPSDSAVFTITGTVCQNATPTVPQILNTVEVMNTSCNTTITETHSLTVPVSVWFDLTGSNGLDPVLTNCTSFPIGLTSKNVTGDFPPAGIQNVNTVSGCFTFDPTFIRPTTQYTFHPDIIAANGGVPPINVVVTGNQVEFEFSTLPGQFDIPLGMVMFSIDFELVCSQPMGVTSPLGNCGIQLNSSNGLVQTCSESGTVEVATVCPVTDALFSVPNTPICAGVGITPVNLSTASNPITYSWSFPGGNPATSNAANPTVIYPFDSTFTITLTADDNCSTDTHSETVTIIDLDINVSPDTSICIGDPPVQLFATVTNGVTYSWSPTADLSATNIPNPIATPTTLGVHTYTLTTTATSTNCTEVDVVTIIVNDIPSSGFTIIDPICLDESSQIIYSGQASGSAQYNWDFGGGVAIPGAGQGPHQLQFSNPGSFPLSLEVIENGCSSLTSQNITVKPVPHAGFIPPAPQNLAANDFDFMIDNSTPTGPGVTYLWTFPGANIPTSTAQNPTGISWAVADTLPVTLTVTEDGCDQSFTDSVRIIAPPMPEFIWVTPAVVNRPVQFTYTGSLDSNQTYSWFFSGGTSPDSTAKHPVATWVSPGIVQVTLTITTPTGTATVSDFVQILADGPPPVVTGPGNATVLNICINEPIDIQAAVAGIPAGCINKYNWFLDGTTIDTFTTPGNVNPGTITMNDTSGNTTLSLGTHTIEVTYDEFIPCNGANTFESAISNRITIIVNPLPGLETDFSDLNVCANEFFTVTAFPALTQTNPLTYQWFEGSLLNPIGAGSVLNELAAYTGSNCDFEMVKYIVVARDVVTGCTNSADVRVSIAPPLIADPGPGGIAYCGDTVELGVDRGCPFPLIYTYAWSPSTSLSHPNSGSPVATSTIKGSGTTTFSLAASQQYFTDPNFICRDTTNVSVTSLAPQSKIICNKFSNAPNVYDGQVFTMTLCISNLGNTDANVQVTDFAPANNSFPGSFSVIKADVDTGQLFPLSDPCPLGPATGPFKCTTASPCGPTSTTVPLYDMSVMIPAQMRFVLKYDVQVRDSGAGPGDCFAGSLVVNDLTEDNNNNLCCPTNTDTCDADICVLSLCPYDVEAGVAMPNVLQSSGGLASRDVFPMMFRKLSRAPLVPAQNGINFYFLYPRDFLEPVLDGMPVPALGSGFGDTLYHSLAPISGFRYDSTVIRANGGVSPVPEITVTEDYYGNNRIQFNFTTTDTFSYNSLTQKNIAGIDFRLTCEAEDLDTLPVFGGGELQRNIIYGGPVGVAVDQEDTRSPEFEIFNDFLILNDPVCALVDVCFDNITPDSTLRAVLYNWDFGLDAIPGSSTLAEPGCISYTTDGVKEVTLIVRDSICPVKQDTVVKMVTILPLPMAHSAGPDIAICLGENTTLSSSATGVSYEWRELPSGNVIGTNVTHPLIGLPVTTRFLLTITDLVTGCRIDDSITVTVNPLPVPDAGPDLTLFCGDQVQIGTTGNSGFGYMWSPGIRLSSLILPNPVASPLQTSTYSVTMTNLVTGCASTDSMTATILDSTRISVTLTANALEVYPQQPIIYTATVCNNSNTDALGLPVSTIYPGVTASCPLGVLFPTGNTALDTVPAILDIPANQCVSFDFLVELCNDSSLAGNGYDVKIAVTDTLCDTTSIGVYEILVVDTTFFVLTTNGVLKNGGLTANCDTFPVCVDPLINMQGNDSLHFLLGFDGSLITPTGDFVLNPSIDSATVTSTFSTFTPSGGQGQEFAELTLSTTGVFDIRAGDQLLCLDFELVCSPQPQFTPLFSYDLTITGGAVTNTRPPSPASLEIDQVCQSTFADFMPGSDPACPRELLSFEPIEVNGNHFWDFGEPASANNTSTAILANHAYHTVGSYTVTHIFSNTCGADTHTVLVNVVDNDPPTIVAPIAISQSNDPGSCGATVALGIPITSDNCGLETPTNDAPSTFPVGTTLVTWMVTDFNLQVASDTQSVTILDQEAPVVLAPPDLIQDAAPGQCQAVVNIGSAVVTDNCAVDTVLNDAPLIFQVGVTTVTWIGIDIYGNRDSATQTITIEDNELPMITAPPAIDTIADTARGCFTAVNLGSPTFSDNCGVLSVTENAPNLFGIGTTLVTWTVTDVYGNQSTVTQEVTVTEPIPPVLFAPAAITQTADPGLCGATVSLGQPTAGDNCGVDSLINDGPSFYPVGTTIVTWTAIDRSGNATTAQQIVTVTDNENPVVIPSPDLLVSVDSGSCNATGVSLGQAASMDNCGVLTVVEDAPQIFPIGITVVTWTVTDVWNNVGTAQQLVTVVDNENPTIIAPIDLTVANDSGQCSAQIPNLGLATTSDNCGTVQVTHTGSGNYPVGTTVVTWTGTDSSGNQASDTQIITVLDQEDPGLIPPADFSLIASGGGCTAITPNLGTAQVFDNCGIEALTDTVYTIDTIAFQPKDTTGLIPVLLGDDAIANNIPIGFTFEFYGTNYTEFLISSNGFIGFPPGNIVNSSAYSGCCTGQQLPDPNTPNGLIAFAWEDLTPALGGTIGYQLRGTAPNRVLQVDFIQVPHYPNGNEVTSQICLFEGTDVIEIHTTSMPANGDLHTFGLENMAGTYSTTVPGRNRAVWSAFNEGIRFTPPVPVPVITNNGADTLTLGANFITWFVNDINGNTSTATQVITLIDTVLPEIQAPADVIQTTDSGLCTATVSIGMAQFSDNCGIDSVFNDAPGSFPLGSTVVTWTLQDLSGNTLTDTQTVTIVDEEIPMIVCPPVANFTCIGDIPQPNIFTVDAADNCTMNPVLTHLSDSGNGGIGCAGNPLLILRTYQAIDQAGNLSSCSQTIHVESDPIIITGSITGASCSDSADGSIQLSIIGGCPPYAFMWSNLATTQDLTGLSSGIYTVNLTDANDCMKSATFTVGEPDLVSATISCCADSVICEGDTAGILFEFSGDAPWVFEFSDGDSIYSRTSPNTTYMLRVAPERTTSYALIAVSSGSTGCVGVVCGRATIGVNACYVPCSSSGSHSSSGSSSGSCDGAGGSGSRSGSGNVSFSGSSGGGNRRCLDECGDMCMNAHIVSMVPSNNCMEITLEIYCDSACFKESNSRSGSCDYERGSGSKSSSRSNSGSHSGSASGSHSGSRSNSGSNSGSASGSHSGSKSNSGSRSHSGSSSSEPTGFVDISVPCGTISRIMTDQVGVDTEQIMDDPISGISGIRTHFLPECTPGKKRKSGSNAPIYSFQINYTVCGDSLTCSSEFCPPMVAFSKEGCLQYERAGDQASAKTGKPLADQLTIPDEERIGKVIAHPNPFESEIYFEVELFQEVETQLVILDLSGRKVKTFHAGLMEMGIHTLVWDGENTAGIPQSAGIYYANIIMGEEKRMIKIVLQK